MNAVNPPRPFSSFLLPLTLFCPGTMTWSIITYWTVSGWWRLLSCVWATATLCPTLIADAEFAYFAVSWWVRCVVSWLFSAAGTVARDSDRASGSWQWPALTLAGHLSWAENEQRDKWAQLNTLDIRDAKNLVCWHGKTQREQLKQRKRVSANMLTVSIQCDCGEVQMACCSRRL